MLLPPEILVLIFSATLDTKTLLSLLRVSRLAKSVAEPLLFNDVVFPYGHPQKIQSRVEAFRKRITADDGNLALRVHSIAAFTPLHIQSVLPLLHELRRLKFMYILDPKDPQLLSESLSPSTRLTHFKCESYIREEVMYTLPTFLESQPSLEYLHFICQVDWEEIVLSAHALPMLCTLVANTRAAFSILPGRNVQHLALHVSRAFNLPSSDLAFETVLTLSCFGPQEELFIPLAVCFPNVKYLKLSYKETRYAVPFNFPEDLRPLSAISVQYISIVFLKELLESGDDVDANAVTLAFKRLPTLRVLDLEWHRFADLCGSPPLASRFYRYRVDDEGGAMLDRDCGNTWPSLREGHEPGDWTSWWEGQIESLHW